MVRIDPHPVLLADQRAHSNSQTALNVGALISQSQRLTPDEVLFSGSPQDDKRLMLQKLAESYGISLSYHNIEGNSIETSDRTLVKLLDAMGVSGIDQPELALKQWENQHWLRGVEPVQVTKKSSLSGEGIYLTVTLPDNTNKSDLTWEFQTEAGTTTRGKLDLSSAMPVETREVDGKLYSRYAVTVPANTTDLETGYHELRLTAGNRDFHQRVIITPAQAYMPRVLEGEGRVWGPATQLYSLKSEKSWGIGSYSDLAQVSKLVADEGGSIVGINPLHALNLQYPQAASPYSPVSRIFMNPLYIDVEAIPEFESWKNAHPEIWNEAFRQKLNALQKFGRVDYQGVAETKLTVLNSMFDDFLKKDLATESDRAKSFRQFQKEGGQSLRQFALFQALQQLFGGEGWMSWEPEYRDPTHPAVKEFAAKHENRIQFFEYLQWIGDSQLGNIKNISNLSLGLYRDLAIGSDRGGFDVWRSPGIYSMKASAGAPPDPLGPKGQNWGLPPFIPHKLKEAAYQPFIETLQTNMRHAGAVRIDHVAGLNRLFWIPNGDEAKDGAYVHYLFEDLLGIIALESHRNKCLVIGEDLGTIPHDIREKMAEWNLFSYKVARWERNWDDKQNGSPFKRPGEYSAHSLVGFSTHDTSTVLGYLTGWLFKTWGRMNIISQDEVSQRVQEAESEIAMLVNALKGEGLLPEQFTWEGLKSSLQQMPNNTVQSFVEAVHRFIARTSSKVALFQFEDALQEEEQPNVPGTADADKADDQGDVKKLPNWRKQYSLQLESFPTDSRITDTFKAFQQERGKQP